MKRKGMSLITLIITVIILVIVTSVIIIGIENTGIIDKAELVVEDMNLKNLEQLANMAYANIYLDNLSKGIRRDITAEEVREHILKNNSNEEELSKYDIIVENGEVFVKVKEEKWK